MGDVKGVKPQNRRETLIGVRPWRWTVSSCFFDRLLGVMILELHGAEIAQCGMQAFCVVDLVDEARKIGGDGLERLLGCQVDGLDLQRLHEAFRFGVDAPISVKG